MQKKLNDFFKNKHVVLPIIHTENLEQARTNVEIAFRCGADGVFLINHSIQYLELIDIYTKLKIQYVDKWFGLNFLDLFPHETFQKIEKSVQGIWVDNAKIDERIEEQAYPKSIIESQLETKFQGLYFGGFAFKYQRKVQDLERAAKIAMNYVDVITTSGDGTGIEADIHKIKTIRKAIGDYPLAIASGITPENVIDYLPYTNCFLVATGISDSFVNLNENRTSQLIKKVRNYNG